jgi:hypothetical protein
LDKNEKVTILSNRFSHPIVWKKNKRMSSRKLILIYLEGFCHIPLKVLREPPIDYLLKPMRVRRPSMAKSTRKPARNTAFAVHFVIKGAEKRRSLAYAKAKMLQRELGVIPRLTCVK